MYSLGRLVESAGNLEVELAMLAVLAGDMPADFAKIRNTDVAGLTRHLERASQRGVFGEKKSRVDALLDRVKLLMERRHAYIHGWWDPYNNTHRRIRDVLNDDFDADRPFDQDDLDELVSAFGSATNELNFVVEFMLARV